MIRLLGSLMGLALWISSLQAQKIWHEAATPDSFASYGMDTLITQAGDTVLVDL